MIIPNRALAVELLAKELHKTFRAATKAFLGIKNHDHGWAACRKKSLEDLPVPEHMRSINHYEK